MDDPEKKRSRGYGAGRAERTRRAKRIAYGAGTCILRVLCADAYVYVCSVFARVRICSDVYLLGCVFAFAYFAYVDDYVDVDVNMAPF